MMTERVHISVDNFGHCHVGSLNMIAVMENPREDLLYTDWDGSWVKKQTLVEEVGGPLMVSVAAVIGGATLATYGLVAASVSVFDRLAGRKGTKRLRFRLDNWMGSLPKWYEMELD